MTFVQYYDHSGTAQRDVQRQKDTVGIAPDRESDLLLVFVESPYAGTVEEARVCKEELYTPQEGRLTMETTELTFYCSETGKQFSVNFESNIDLNAEVEP